jgi:Alkylmercury lyase
MAETTLVQQAYTTVLRHLVMTGRAPHYTELAAVLGLKPDEARKAQRKAAESALGCWFAGDTDYVESWAPFSNLPTQYLVTIKGEQKWYGQWGLEALAVRWLFPGTEVRIDARCLECGEPILVRMRDEEILEVDPATSVGHMNVPFASLLGRKVSHGYAWSGMNLFRSEEHVKRWSLYDAVSAESVMPLSDWALVFSGPAFRKRLEPDYLSRIKEYAPVLFSTLQKLGKSGPFWRP